MGGRRIGRGNLLEEERGSSHGDCIARTARVVELKDTLQQAAESSMPPSSLRPQNIRSQQLQILPGILQVRHSGQDNGLAE